MQRRQFAFSTGLSLFWIADRLRADSLDGLATALLETADRQEATAGERWQANENRRWFWFEREKRLGQKWVKTGITTPINKITGEEYDGEKGYLDPSLVPDSTRTAATRLREKFKEATVDVGRRARHGRPPSRWLRSLEARELRIWLKTIDVPEAGVEGVTFWTHLTRDHSFLVDNITGLTIPEQAKLHAAAHHGY